MPVSRKQVDERVVGFVDVGTNSVRLLLVRISPNHSYTTLTQQKQVVRLGDGEFVDQYLQQEAMDRAVLVCRKFVELARAYGAQEIVAVATSAARDANNRNEFVRRLRREADLEVHVISGKEEARLIYLGVASGIHLGEHRAVFIDIGGGSTEIIAGSQSQYQRLESLNLGAVRLTTLFFLPNEATPVSTDRYALLQRYVRSAAVRAVQEVRPLGCKLAFGSSGTIENLMDLAARGLHNRARQREDTLTASDLRKVVERLCALPLEERRKLPGINPERADIIIAGAAILQTLMQDLSLAEIRVVADRGLREGLLADYLARGGNAALVNGGSVRERSVLQLGRACGFDETHARHIADLTLELFDSAAKIGLHSYGAHERELARYAALLHDIGAFLSYDNHHLHAYYLIQNADLLGFDQSEIAIMAAAALFHRKAAPAKKYREFKALDKSSRKLVKVLSTFLRLAEGLDRSHMGLVRHTRLRHSGKGDLTLEIRGTKDCQLEVWGVQDRVKVAEKILRRKLKIKVIAEAEGAAKRRPEAAAAIAAAPLTTH